MSGKKGLLTTAKQFATWRRGVGMQPSEYRVTLRCPPAPEILNAARSMMAGATPAEAKARASLREGFHRKAKNRKGG